MENSNQNPKQALVDKLKDAKNVLVTVTSDPNVDQLAACLGMTIWLNKLGKHATAVFSGNVPSTLEFLKPEETLEKTTDSLRDFIISLDKSKADKLRYKVEDSVVKVFVTPYRTSLSVDDLEFSQGDFNVDLVIALGVHNQDELDSSVTSHGRILHDATVATVTIGEAGSELGAINWHDGQASSLCELVVDYANSVDKEQIDSQIATALLTGVVAETERFSNNKTTPQTMSVSAQLMSAGANQQLVASKLEEPLVEPEPEQHDQSDAAPEQEPVQARDGALSVNHEDQPETESEQQPEFDESVQNQEQSATEAAADESAEPEVTRFMDEAPDHTGTLTANAQPEDETAEPSSDPLSQPHDEQPLMQHKEKNIEPDAMQPAPPNWMPPQPWMNQPSTEQPMPEGQSPEPQPALDTPAEETEPTPDSADLPGSDEAPAAESTTSIEEPPTEQPTPEVQSPEPQPAVTPNDSATPDLDAARDEVQKAMEASQSSAQEPVQALNALPIDLNQPTDQPEQVIEATPTMPPVSNTAFDHSAFGVINDPEMTIQHDGAAAVDPNQPVAPELTGPVEQPFTMPLPTPLTPPPASPTPPTSVEFDPTAPPPVPPPFAPKQN